MKSPIFSLIGAAAVGAWSPASKVKRSAIAGRTSIVYVQSGAEDPEKISSTGTKIDPILEQEVPSSSTTAPLATTVVSSLDGGQGQPGDKLLAVANIAILGIATVGMADWWNSMLLDFEWMQEWRYAWPCIGLIFMYEGYNSLAEDFEQLPKLRPPLDDGYDKTDDDISISQLASETISLQSDRPVWLRVTAILAGASLVIGGAADALLPVYVTGPNLFTRAGLAPDTAAFLAVFQATVLAGRVWSNRKMNLTVCGAHVLLLSQLLILGAGSFDEVATFVVENVNVT